VRIDWVRSVLLLCANFFPVDKISLISALNRFVLRKDTIHTGWILGSSLAFRKAHGHRWWCLSSDWWWSNSTNNTNSMMVICHFKYFLLLGSQTILIWIWLIFLLTVHVCESHSSRHEYVIIILTRAVIRPINLSVIRWCNLLMNVVIMVMLQVVVV